MIGIVNKPQFDTSIFTVGKAIHIKNNRGFGFEEVDALINQSSPLAITVSYCNTQGKLLNEIISIQDVTDKSYTISFFDTFGKSNDGIINSWEIVESEKSVMQ